MASLTLTWTDTSGDGVGNATDILYGAIHSPDTNNVMAIPPLVARSVETQVIELPEGFSDGATLNVWAAWRRADGLDASDTMFCEANQN